LKCQPECTVHSSTEWESWRRELFRQRYWL